MPSVRTDRSGHVELHAVTNANIAAQGTHSGSALHIERVENVARTITSS